MLGLSHHSARGSVSHASGLATTNAGGLGLLGEGIGGDGSGDLEGLTKVLDTLVVEDVVVISPVVLLSDQLTGLHGTHGEHNVQVRHAQSLVLELLGVLSDDDDALCKKINDVLKEGQAVGQQMYSRTCAHYCA